MTAAQSITSLQNPRVKNVVRLGSRRHRDQAQQTVVEGVREADLALESGVIPVEVYVCPELLEKAGGHDLRRGLQELAANRQTRLFEVPAVVYNKMAYKRTPASLYGADAYIEKHHIPNDLVAYVHRLVTDAAPADAAAPPEPEEETVAGESPSPAEEREVREFTQEVNTKILQAEEEETSAGVSNNVPEKAHRLARNIVADIALYNQEKVEEGVQSGTFFDLLAKEIAEGRRLFQERFPDLVANNNDILQAEFNSFIERKKADIST